MLAADQGGRHLHRLEMILQGLPVIRLGTRSRQVAQQAQCAGFHVRTLRAELDCLVGLVGGFFSNPACANTLACVTR